MAEKNADGGPYNIYTEVPIKVEFFDCDPMQVVYHGNYINYFEIARRALLEKIGYGYEQMKETRCAFPIIEIQAKYIGSLRFGDEAAVRAVLTEYENRIRMKFEIRNAAGTVVTKGQSTQMAVSMETGESCFICPAVFIEKVEKLIAAGGFS